MAKHENSAGIPLPRGWPRRVKSAMLNVIALAQYAAAYTRSWAINGRIARVGDLFMSLIHTCQLCGVDPFDYLTTLQRHAAELSSAPAKWMPWNYRDTLTPA